MSGVWRIHRHGHLPPHSFGVLQLPALERDNKEGSEKEEEMSTREEEMQNRLHVEEYINENKCNLAEHFSAVCFY